MGKLFGTDGIRGVVGENLTVDLAFQVGRALTTVLAEEKKHRLAIAIGKDTRISSDMLEAALMAGICAAGGDDPDPGRRVSDRSGKGGRGHRHLGLAQSL